MKCPICKGEGVLAEFIDLVLGSYYSPCGACNKTGKVSLWWMISYLFWSNVSVSFVEWYADIILKWRKDER